MRKYNMNDDQNCVGSGIQGSFPQGPFPYFDIPCLYYPQYPCSWGSTSRCKTPYGIFGITGSKDCLLQLENAVSEGRAIQLREDGVTLLLQPGRLYLLNYQVQGCGGAFQVVPVIDGCCDELGAACSCGQEGPEGRHCASGNLLLPVVDSSTTLQFRLQSPAGCKLPCSLRGMVSLVALSCIQ